ALCQVRTKDFIDLKSLLEEQMTVDNQPQVYQM
ncbi:TPA: F-box protein, partial [Legionella pneumophila subsp. pneumophila]|nr:F-box protein [Legionella pneumophila subsp. pneumophila]